MEFPDNPIFKHSKDFRRVFKVVHAYGADGATCHDVCMSLSKLKAQTVRAKLVEMIRKGVLVYGDPCGDPDRRGKGNDGRMVDTYVTRANASQEEAVA